MPLVHPLNLLWALFLFPISSTSNVVFRNNGYENVLIAIHPEIPENDDIITNIQAMINDSSSYLFRATRQRAYFRDIKILIPVTWTNKSTYQRPKRETFDNADVIVAEPYLKYGDDPYTLQYGGCGETGRYIHLTPNFLLDDGLLNVYGPRGKLLVHEWAHLRWGVFDEYNADRPFYISEAGNIEATRCSKDIRGVLACHGPACICKKDPATGLPDEDCMFVPDKVQSATSSVMYLQGLSSVVDFCDDTTHNFEAPNLQNQKCNYRSTWDVISNSKDLKDTTPMTSSPPPPIVTLLQAGARVICLVLDVSENMNSHNRIQRMKQAAEVFFLQAIEMGSYAGIVAYESTATIRKDLILIDSVARREELVRALPTTAGGGLNICAGILKGFEVIQKYNGETSGMEVQVLTAGEDDGLRNCFAQVEQSGSIIHTISLGSNAAKELAQLSDMTGGHKFYATDNLDSNSLIDAFLGISSESPSTLNQSIQLISNSLNIKTKEWLNDTVPIDKSIGNNTFFVVTWQTSEPAIYLQTPSGRTYTTANFAKDAVLKTARLQIPGTAETGDWIYGLYNTHRNSQALGITVTSRAADHSVPHVTVNAYMKFYTDVYPSPMIVYAEVSQGFMPVVGAQVIATVEPKTGTPVTLELFDNGAGPDIAKRDGVYSRYFTSYKNGWYSLKVKVQGKKTTRLASWRQNHVVYIPGYVNNGQIQFNPSKPAMNDEDVNVNTGSFSRTSSGGTFSVDGIPSGTFSDIFPPSKITDLEATIKENNFILKWTAPGNDYDLGTASTYEIRMSKNPVTLRNNFSKTEQISTSSLAPLPAGSQQIFSFQFEDVIKNGTILYFAAVAYDAALNKAHISNIAQTMMIIPSSSPIDEAGNGVNINMFVLIASGSLILVLIIVSAVVFGINSKRKKTSPQAA